MIVDKTASGIMYIIDNPWNFLSSWEAAAAGRQKSEHCMAVMRCMEFAAELSSANEC
jgi:hypothetical protein